jgi:hypothetical protein
MWNDNIKCTLRNQYGIKMGMRVCGNFDCLKISSPSVKSNETLETTKRSELIENCKKKKRVIIYIIILAL